MSKISYDTLLDGITDSCALTQPVASAARNVVPRRVATPVPQTTGSAEPPPTDVSGSQPPQVLENISINGSQITGTAKLDLKPYQDAVAAISLPASRDVVLQSSIKSTKIKPSVDSLLGIDSAGKTIYTPDAQGSALLNSDRIIINAKQQFAMLFGQKGVAIASPTRVNIDAGESITLAAQGGNDGGLFLGLPNRGLRYESQTQQQIGDSKGDPTPDKPYEPLVLGVKLANWIEDFLTVLKNAVGTDGLSNVKFQPTTQAEFGLLANRIPEILSNYAYIDGVSHGSIDMTQLAAIKESLSTTPDYVPPQKLTGKVTGQVVITGTSGGPEVFGGPGLDPIKNLIVSHESGGDYDVYNFGTSGGGGIRSSKAGSPYYSAKAVKLTDKTVSQIIALQNGSENLFAVGKYQTIPVTLKSVATRLGLLNSLFDQTTQEKIGDSLLLTSRPKLGSYLKGTNGGTAQDLAAAVQDLGQEFASLPIITKGGTTYGDVTTGTGNKAYYGGSGPNPDSVKTSVGTVVKALIKSRTQFSSAPSFIPPYAAV